MKKQKIEDAAMVCSRSEECIHQGQDCSEAGGAGREFACFGTNDDCIIERVQVSREDLAKMIGVGEAVSEDAPVEDVVFICDETSETFTRILPVMLTAEEQAVMGAEMARLINVWTRAKLDKQAFDKSMKNLIDSTEEDYISIAVKATDGTEDRPTECYWQMDRTHGLKRLYRCDTGAIVEEVNMELLDYDHGKIDPEDSVKNVEAMVQGQQALSLGAESVQTDTDTAANLFDAPQGKPDASNDGWPDSPNMSDSEDAIP